jgi:hypothetical protein
MNGNDRDFHDTGTRGSDERDAMRAGQAGAGQAAAGQAAAGWERPRRSPALATMLSMMPGLGHIYLGYYQQGFINIAIIAGCITALSSNDFEGLEPFIALGMAFYWLFNLVDANRRAHHFNRVAAGLGAEKFPDEFPMPKSRGSMFNGMLLIGVGLLFILDLNFDIPLDWLADWWPLVLVLFGARMVWNSRRKAG